MSVPRNRDALIRFPVGVPNTSSPGVAYFLYQRGYNRTTEARDTPFAYAGFKDFGRVVRDSPVPINTYSPNPEDAEFKIRSSLWRYGAGSSYASSARNAAWSDLMDDIKGPTSALGTTAAEGREAFEMVATRATGLYRSYKALRKGDFRKFLKELSVSPKRKHRSKTRAAAHETTGLWLEYWFGWSPTLQDIYDSLNVLTSDPILGRSTCVGTARKPVSSSGGLGTGGDYRRSQTEEGVIFVKQGCDVEISNYNLFLLNRLGLVNPAAIAWELVPFSFVVDWFAKVGDSIHGYTDLVGIKVSKPYTTVYSRLKLRGEYGSVKQVVVEWNTYTHQRGTTLSRPVPIFPRISNFGTSRTRAATAVSLLTQLFLTGK